MTARWLVAAPAVHAPGNWAVLLPRWPPPPQLLFRDTHIPLRRGRQAGVSPAHHLTFHCSPPPLQGTSLGGSGRHPAAAAAAAALLAMALVVSAVLYLDEEQVFMRSGVARLKATLDAAHTLGTGLGLGGGGESGGSGGGGGGRGGGRGPQPEPGALGCVLSGYCSVGQVATFRGDIATNAALGEMLQAVSFRKEVRRGAQGHAEGLGLPRPACSACPALPAA